MAFSSRLVFGRPARDGEVFVTGDAHPDAVRAAVHAALGVGWEDDGRPGRDPRLHRNDGVTVVTYSPVAMDAWVRASLVTRGADTFEEDVADLFARVLYHRDGVDHPLADFVAPVWLVHFDLGDLWRDGEVDARLDERAARAAGANDPPRSAAPRIAVAAAVAACACVASVVFFALTRDRGYLAVAAALLALAVNDAHEALAARRRHAAAVAAHRAALADAEAALRRLADERGGGGR